MKPLAVLATLLTSLQLSKADFYVWAVDIQDFWGGQSEGYAVYAGDPSCADVGSVGSWNKQSDVSGRKTGVRCNGNCGLGEDPNGITQFEMHWTNNPLFHWTLYKDRGHPYKMYGLDGRTYGECSRYGGKQFHCPNFGSIHGYRKFHCRTQFTAAQIHAGSR